jgi:predicted Fe-Mo cluster-binding NifX family protein
VDTQILGLRKKLGQAGNVIETIRGVGYRFRSDMAKTTDEDNAVLRQADDCRQEQEKLKKFAVASKTGAVVDLHFGHTDEFYIYESDGQQTRFLETRKVSKYCQNGSEDRSKEDRWDGVISALADCSAVLALRIGPTPEKRLNDSGIKTIMTYEMAEKAVAMAAKEINKEAVPLQEYKV